MEIMKKNFCILAIFMSLINVSCGGDSDGDVNGGEAFDVNAIIGRTYSWIDTSYGEYNGATANYDVTFKDKNFATVKIWGRDLDIHDEDIYTSYNLGDIDCPYDVKGNLVIIHYRSTNGGEKDIHIQFSGTKDVKWLLAEYTNPAGNVSLTAPCGFYSNDSFDNLIKENVKTLQDFGDYTLNSWKSLESYNAICFKLVDEWTISETYQMVSINTPPSQKYNNVVYKTENYSVGSGSHRTTYTLYYYYSGDLYPLQYVTRDGKMYLGNGEVMSYINGKLVTDKGVSFTLVVKNGK